MAIARFPTFLSPKLQDQRDTVIEISKSEHYGTVSREEALGIAKITLADFTKNDSLDSILTNFTIKVLSLDPDSVDFINPINEGSSEEQVYIVKSLSTNQSFAIFKIFKENSENFLDEIFSLQFLSAARIPGFFSPRINALGKYRLENNNYFLLCESAAPGQSLMSYYQQPNQFDILEKGIQKCGFALAKLHQYLPESRKGIPNSLQNKAREDLTKAIENLTTIPQPSILIEKLQALFDRTLKTANEDILRIGVVHGDPTLENVFFDPGSDTITWIDPPTLARSIDSTHEPIGIPARDFHLFIANLRHKQVNYILNSKNQIGRQNRISDERVSTLINTFYLGYIGSKQPVPTKNQIDFFSLASHLSMIASANVFDPECSLPEPLKSSEKHQIEKIFEDLKLQLKHFQLPTAQGGS